MKAELRILHNATIYVTLTPDNKYEDRILQLLLRDDALPVEVRPDWKRYLIDKELSTLTLRQPVGKPEVDQEELK